MKVAARRVARTTSIGTPVGSSPAGNYVGCYWQYGRCHLIPAQHLTCIPLGMANGSVQGHGIDDVGSFHTHGSYVGTQLALTKQYVPGTGDPRENAGHFVQLRLMCCELFMAMPERAEALRMAGALPGTIGFFGTWHVRTRSYRGDAEMCLWLPSTTVVAVGQTVPAVAVVQPLGTAALPAGAPACHGAPLPPLAVPVAQAVPMVYPQAHAAINSSVQPLQGPAAPMAAAGQEPGRALRDHGVDGVDAQGKPPQGAGLYPQPM